MILSLLVSVMMIGNKFQSVHPPNGGLKIEQPSPPTALNKTAIMSVSVEMKLGWCTLIEAMLPNAVKL
jgi:hypothetical protein